MEMKKMLAAGSAFVLAAALLSGCSGTAEPAETQAASEAPQTSQVPAQADFDSMVFGEVQSVDGSSITLELGTVEGFSAFTPDGDGQPTPPDGDKPSGEKPSGEKPSEEQSESEKPDAEPPAGEQPDGELPEGATPPTGQSPSDVQVTMTKTGETATYTLPEGLKLGGTEETAVTVGMNLALSLDAEGNVVAAQVLPQ